MVRVTLKPSRQLAIALTVVHLGALVTLAPLDLPWWTKVGLATVVAANFVYGVRRYALLAGRSAAVAVELHELDRAAVQIRDGDWQDARVLETTYVSPWLSVLNLRLAGRFAARHMIIVADNVDPEDFRRLRVWLRWGYRKAPATGRGEPQDSPQRSAGPL